MSPQGGESRNSRIGAKIRRQRQALGWEQEELAERVGVHVNSVQKWEAGVHYPSRKLGKLEQVLGISLDDDDSDRPAPSVLDDVFGAADAEEFRHRVRARRGQDADWFLARVEEALSQPREGEGETGVRQVPR